MRKFGPPPGIDTESALIARDEHRQGGRGAAWARDQHAHRESIIREWQTRSVDTRRDSPLS